MASTTVPGFAVAVLLAVAAAPLAVPAQHEHAASANDTATVAPPANRWAADADLADGIARIDSALGILRTYEAGHIDAGTAMAQSSRIRQAAADIFAKCQLPPEQDAVLHRMLAPLLAANERFRSNPKDLASIDAMRDAMADYPRYFDAPTFAAGSNRGH